MFKDPGFSLINRRYKYTYLLHSFMYLKTFALWIH